MNRKKQLMALPLACVALTAGAWNLDWNKIEHWAGEGPSRSALVVQFQDNGPEESYVWGFRWNPADYEGGQPSGEDMFRAIAASSSDILLFTQYTGWMGSTVDGIGFQFPGEEKTLHNIVYDFEGASSDPRVSFDYFTPNELMGQTSAPGMFSPVYCRQAIEAAEATNVIEHPLNAREYGYPAYDYDWWQPSAPLDNNRMRWNAGWYDGYWSYWVGGTDSDELSYSGLGYSSRKLSDGAVDGWKYALLDGPVVFAPRRTGAQNRIRERIDGETGASEQWHRLNYSHTRGGVGVETVAATPQTAVAEIYTMQGLRVRSVKADALADAIDALPAGVYIVKQGSKSTKLIK